jgi:hypothetical protein
MIGSMLTCRTSKTGLAMAKKKVVAERTPAEVAALTRSVMARMLATPPTPHEHGNGKRKRKAGKQKRAK